MPDLSIVFAGRIPCKRCKATGLIRKRGRVGGPIPGDKEPCPKCCGRGYNEKWVSAAELWAAVQKEKKK